MTRSLAQYLLAVVAFTAFLSLYPTWGQDLDIKAATDGRCDYWLPMLQANPDEQVVFTGTDQFGEKVKVLSDGKAWRMVLLAGAEKPLFGCVFLEGGGEIVP